MISQILLSIPFLIAAGAMVRIQLVFSYRDRLHDEILASAGSCDPHIQALRNELNRVSHNQMVLDLRKWTFKHFYPDVRL